MKKQPKEKPMAGFCIVRPDIIKQGLSVPVGNLKCDANDAIPYRWLKDDSGFQVLYLGAWRNAESIDFDFLDKEKEIVKLVFKNYDYSDAIEEIKDWSAEYLKQFLRVLGYKTYIKEIMVSMVQDLARMHRWNIKLETPNIWLEK